MRFLITLALIVIAPLTASAQTSEQIEMCAAVGEFVEVVFDARANGVPLSAVLALVMSQESTSDSEKDLWSQVVQTAYAEPTYHGEEAQRRQVLTFRSEAEVACFSGFGL